MKKVAAKNNGKLLSRNQVLIFISVALCIILGIYFYALLQARMDLNIQNDGFKLTAAQFLVIAMHPVITAFAWILTPLGAYILLEKGKKSKLGITLLIGGLIAALALVLGS